MVNSTKISYFILSSYLDSGPLKYLFFIIVLLLYVIIVFSNLLLIVVICINRSLHEPMYLFLCSLFVNQLYGSVGLFPFLLVQILSDTHTVSASVCYLQMYCLYTYGNTEFCSLALMSYDRYLAICCPLQYNTRMTSNKVAVLIVVVWLYCFLKSIISLSLSSHLLLCGNILNSLYCNNYLVVKLACSDTRVNNIYGLVISAVSILLPLILILFSYMKILQICFASSKETRHKAVSTCTPHLVSLLNFSFGCCFETFLTRLDLTSIPNVLRLILSLYFLIIQPLLNPIMYGLRLTKIRKGCKNVVSCKVLDTQINTHDRHCCLFCLSLT